MAAGWGQSHGSNPSSWWVQGTQACPSFPFTLKCQWDFQLLEMVRAPNVSSHPGAGKMDCCLSVFSCLCCWKGWKLGIWSRRLQELKFTFSESSSACKAQGCELLYVLFPKKADGRVCAPWAVAEEGLAPLQTPQLVMGWFQPELCCTGQPLQPCPPAPVACGRGCARTRGHPRVNWGQGDTKELCRCGKSFLDLLEVVARKQAQRELELEGSLVKAQCFVQV